MDRRSFLASSSALAIGSLVRSSAAAELRTIGLLWVSSPGTERLKGVLRESLRAQGFDQNAIRFEHDTSVDRYEALEGAAQRMVQKRVDLIVAYGMTAAKTAVRTTPHVPVVFLVTNDPVADKIVASLARPGGNATGVRLSPTDQTGKRFEFLRRLTPSARRVGHVYNQSSAAEVSNFPTIVRLGKAVGFEIEPVTVRVSADIQPAIAAAVRSGVQGFGVASSTMLVANARNVTDAINAGRLPVVYPNSDYVDAGGLVSYGPNLTVAFSRGAVFIGSILKGARPADLPVEQSDKYELVAHVAAAKRQGIVIPQDILGLADRVIET
jgi:putative ABC transport system substrate-binding protein